MQARSNTWKELAETGNFRLESVAVIGGVQYASISSPVIERALFSGSPEIGNCVSATLQFSILTDDDIAKSAEITIRKRITDNTTFSEWLEAGTFFISKRSKDPVTGLLTLQCYDAMLKANVAYPITSESSFPKPMTECISEIAAKIGVDIDPRTWDYVAIGPEYVVQYPLDLTMMEVLGYIGGVNGGNWVITPNNKLRLIPMLSAANAESNTDGSRLDVRGVIGKIATGSSLTIRGIKANIDGETMMAGDENGLVLSLGTNPYATQKICEALLAKLSGTIYAPFTLERAVYDPAAELGDYVVCKDDVRSVLYYEKSTLDIAFRGDISAPYSAELEDEYPYRGTSQRLEALSDGLKTNARETRAEIIKLQNLIELRVTESDLENALANIHVGGRNLLRDTQSYRSWICSNSFFSLEGGIVTLSAKGQTSNTYTLRLVSVMQKLFLLKFS